MKALFYLRMMRSLWWGVIKSKKVGKALIEIHLCSDRMYNEYLKISTK